MPVESYVSGTLKRKVVPGASAAKGTLEVGGYSASYADGTLEVDRTLFLAFYARVRGCRPDVFVEDELMANLVETVELDSSLADPIGYATFTLSDKRVAFFDAASVSNGERDIAIDFWAGPFGAILKWRAFVGTTESSQNTMPYRPRGVFKCVSNSAKWANRNGCLNIPAFSGLTRGEIIAAFAETAGVTIANAADIGGGVVRKPLDIAGKTPFQLIQEYGEIEGWYARRTLDGLGLEIVPEDRLLDGAPVFAFDESNTFDVPETEPDRPVTDWILSTTQPATPAGGAGSGIETATSTVTSIDEAGHHATILTEITTDHGIEIKSVVTQWKEVQTPGTIVYPFAMQMISRDTILTTWAPFSYVDADGVSQTMPSTMLTARQTITEELAGVPNATTSGFAWTTGGNWTDIFARLIETKRVDEFYTYDPGTCFQATGRVVTYAYYSPLKSAGAGGLLYLDGSTRQDANYLFQEVQKDEFQWTAAARPGAAPRGFLHFVASSKWTGTLSPATNIELYGTASSTTDSETPPTGSASIPQFGQEVVQFEFDATAASGYARRTDSGMIDIAESVEELESIARRRIRRACSVTLDIPHNAVPFLREGDHVAVTNHARSLVDADAYVLAIKRTAAVKNGAMRQVTTVAIPPDWI